MVGEAGSSGSMKFRGATSQVTIENNILLIPITKERCRKSHVKRRGGGGEVYPALNRIQWIYVLKY